MTVDMLHQPPAGLGRVIALHCSGASAGQWRALAEGLGSQYAIEAPEHYGCDSTGTWSGEHVFTLADEAKRAIALIDGSEGSVHLVGHSYGGGVALYAALARPNRIASTHERCAAITLAPPDSRRPPAKFARVRSEQATETNKTNKTANSGAGSRNCNLRLAVLSLPSNQGSVRR